MVLFLCYLNKSLFYQYLDSSPEDIMQTDGIISYNVCGVLFCPSFLWVLPIVQNQQ